MITSKKILHVTTVYSLFLLCFAGLAYFFGQLHYFEFTQATNLITAGYSTFHSYLMLSAQRIVDIFGESDPATYIKSAFFFSSHGYFLNEFAILWPPGQALTILGIVKLFGESAYPLKMLILSTIFWPIALTQLYYSWTKIQYSILKFVLSLLPMFLLSFQTWLFGYNLILSENLTLPLFISAICFILQWIREKKYIYLIASAIIFAVMSYYRGYFEVFSRFIMVFVIIYFAYISFKNIYFQKLGSPTLSTFAAVKYTAANFKFFYSPKLRTIIAALLVFSVLLIPWRIYMFNHFHSFSWQNLNYSWALLWDKSATSFSTANIGCLVDPKWCDFFYEHDIKNFHGTLLGGKFYAIMTLGAFLLHPLEWYTIKLHAFNHFWYGGNLGAPTWSELLNNYKVLFIENTLVLLAGLSTLIIGKLRWKKLSVPKKDFMLFSFLFVLFNFVLFTFFHFEPRYSLYLQLFFIYLPFWLLFSCEIPEQKP
jgi:hypothetical protein